MSLSLPTDPARADAALYFGPFRFLPRQRALFEGDAPVRLGARALDLLSLLLERAGELVAREELMAAAWPGLAVEDINLRVQIAALRKVLGDGRAGARYIVVSPGRGYLFAAPVREAPAPGPADPPPAPAATPTRLPPSLSHIVGRERAITLVAQQLRERRLLTVVGPGGVGKTTVALASAERFLAEAPQAATFVDLQTLGDPATVAGALAGLLRVPSMSSEAADVVADFLTDKQGLIIFDNCEHLIDAVAPLAEAIIRAAPQISILATSREPLRAEGEWVHHLASLAAPPAHAGLTAARALSFPAVELFIDRVAAHIHGFQLEDADADAAGEICRRLDGIPLAIELAAARVELFGLPGLAAGLDARFAILTAGRRTALPRHQTLRATLDWSYELLTAQERAALRRVAVFAGDFTIEAATAVATGEGLTASQTPEAVMSLADKSLLAIDGGGEAVCFRLLETTRAYALETLTDPDERAGVLSRHAVWCLDTLRRAETDWTTLPMLQWMSLYGPRIDDVRAALDWAYADGGDTTLGAELTILAAGLAQLLSFYAEFHGRTQRALERLGPDPDPVIEARLNLALGNLAFNLFGPTDDLVKPFQRALDLADQTGDEASLIEALAGMWLWAYAFADYPKARAYVDRLNQAMGAHGDTSRRRTIDRMAAITTLFTGDPADADRRARAALDEPPTRLRPSFRSTVQLDREVTMRMTLARTTWALGRPDDAVAMALEAMARAERFGTLMESCLGFCLLPLTLWRGDLDGGRALAARLKGVAAAGEANIWRGWSRAYDTLLDPDRAAQIPALEQGLDDMQLDTFATLDPAVVGPRCLARAEAGVSPWCAPEMFRGAGVNRLARGGEGAAAEAEALFRRALDLAERQNWLAWRLRAAASLTEVRRGQDQPAAVRDRLAPLLDQFVQGRDTADVRRAAALLTELG